MADVSEIFSVNAGVPVELKRPDNGESVGITIYVQSLESVDVARATKIVQTDKWHALFESKRDKMDASEAVDFHDRTERDQLIAAIVGWDFGENSFGDLNADSDLSLENRTYLVDHPRAGWIRAQLSKKVNDLSNFTSPSD